VLGVLAFRGLYHAVPLMLALGLGVLFALAVLLLVRLVRERDFRFQDVPLRAGGRLTRAGRTACALALALVLFTLHSSVVRASTRLGVLRIEQAQRSSGPPRDELLERANVHLTRALRLGLIEDPEVEYRLGLVALASGRYPEARGRLERAIRGAPDMAGPRLSLAECLLAVRDWSAARPVLDALLERHPNDVQARWRRAQVSIALGDLERAEAALTELLRDAPEHEGARADLARVREVLGRSPE